MNVCGGASIIVLLFHVFCRFSQIYLDTNILWMSRFGNIGVEIFLVITGYYLVDFERDEKSFSIGRYLKSRLLKLWPLYVISITVTAIVVHLFYLPERMSTWADWLLNLLFINGFIGTPYVDGAHWYMTTLVAVTMVMAIAKKIKQEKSPLFYIAWMGVTLISSFLDIPYVVSLIGGSYAGIISISVALRFVSQKKKETTKKSLLLWTCVALCATGCTAIYNGIVSLLEMLIIIPIFLCCINKKMPFLENRILLFGGSISYPLYLIHQNISFEVEYYFMKYLWVL